MWVSCWLCVGYALVVLVVCWLVVGALLVSRLLGDGYVLVSVSVK